MQKDDRRDLTEVRVNKQRMLDKLRQNREQHMADYKEAKAGWKEAVVALALDLAKVAQEKGAEAVSDLQDLASKVVHERKPVSHVKDYDHIIDLLEASEDDEFVITASDFARYWRDEWNWKGGFAETVNKYSSNR